MMRWSSHFKAIVGASFAALGGAFGLVWALMVSQVDPVAAGAAALTAVFASAAVVYLKIQQRGIEEITRICMRAAEGDLEARIVIDADGATGRLISAINRVLDVSDAFLREAMAASEHMRDGKFYRKLIERGLPGAYRYGARCINVAMGATASKLQENLKIASGFEATLQGVVGTVASAAAQLRGTAESVSNSAEDTSRRSAAVATASEQASTNVQTVAAAAEELAASVAEIGRQVSRSTSIASSAVEEANRTNVSVQGLVEAVGKIGDVVKLINDIAGQTNLLALNATIEAARAGEAGKGFAVVASEVKNLATQTAKATDDIGSQIGGIQMATRQAVEAIQGISGTIEQISEIATTIASAVEEQSAATQEIARNVQQASGATSQVSSNISGVTRAAAETGKATQQVLGAADALAREAERMRTEVGTFFARVRAG